MRIASKIVAIIAILLCCVIGQASKREDQGPRILIVSSYNPDAVSASRTINDFVDYYQEHGPGGTVMIENMNCKSLSEAHLWTSRAREIIAKYDDPEIKPSLMVLLGQEAWASFLSVNPAELKDQYPIMCCMASRNIVRMPADTCRLDTWLPSSVDYTFLRSRYNLVGGTLYEYDIDRNIDLIKKYYPDTKSVALLTDNSYGGLTLLAHFNDCMRKYPEYKFIKLDGRVKTIYSMSEAIDKLPPKTVLVIGTWRVDKTESFYVKNSTQILMNANPNVPVITLSTIGMGYWALGGYMPQYHAQGEELAQKVIDYLDDVRRGVARKPGDGITITPGHYVFDKEKLEQLNINISSLPEDSELMNFTPSFYEQNKYVIWIVLSIFFVLITILGIVTWFLGKTRRLTQSLQVYQEELIVAKEKAEESNKQKTAFLANMSHEIRTPLNAIVGFADVLTNDDTLKAEEKLQINDIISKNSQMLLGLINDILDMSRLESGRTKYVTATCDVVEMCQDTLETCKIAARRDDIEYELRTTEDHCYAVIDRQHIRQVLINLISNSNKFTKSGRITLSFVKGKDVLQFAVEDTGIGIPRDKQQRIFERFEKVSEMTQGFGIGLSLCMNIVTHFGGKIYVDPEYQGGARFVFTLPFIAPDSEEDNPTD